MAKIKKGQISMWQQLRLWAQYNIDRCKSWCQNPATLRLSQQEKIQDLLRHLYVNIPFYQDFRGNKFHSLPVIDKTIMQESFSDLNAIGLAPEECATYPYTLQRSAGTSGNTGIYLYSHKEMRVAFSDLLSKMFTGIYPAKKVAIFHLSNEPYFPKPLISEGFHWCFFNLQKNFDSLITSLQNFSPEVIIAPVQTLCKIAALQETKQIFLDPKKIVATSEVLTVLEQKGLASIFGQKIYQLYQCAEGWLGMTCEHGTWHMNEDMFLIEKEWVDEKNHRFVPVITSLTRYTQPLVRYRMEDILVQRKDPCPCGSALLAVDRIIGRCEDVLYFSENSSHHALKPLYPDHIEKVVLQAQGGIKKFQICQSSPLHLVVKLHAENYAKAIEGFEAYLAKLCYTHAVKTPKVEFTPFQDIPLNQMFRQTKRLERFN